ncbi:MAG: response regulator [Gammaproteobacteria bacterium]|nr:response regulator [Gammaproteobacteria bacterium]
MSVKRENKMAENPKILIVDDDPGIRSQLKWGFEGFDVVTAENRADALEQFSKYHPAVVTLDLGLPPDAEGSNEGFAILKQILEEAPGTKVVIVSGSDEKTNAKRAVDSGAFEFFAKPVDLVKLNMIIERAYKAYKETI